MLIVSMLLMAATAGLANALQTASAAGRDLGFVGMGASLLEIRWTQETTSLRATRPKGDGSKPLGTVFDLVRATRCGGR